MRLLGEPACRVLFCNKPNIVLLSHVFNGLAVRSIVYQLVEVPFHLFSFALPLLLCIVVDLRLNVGTGFKADGTMHFDELHSTIKVELK